MAGILLQVLIAGSNQPYFHELDDGAIQGGQQFNFLH